MSIDGALKHRHPAVLLRMAAGQNRRDRTGAETEDGVEASPMGSHITKKWRSLDPFPSEPIDQNEDIGGMPGHC